MSEGEFVHLQLLDGKKKTHLGLMVDDGSQVSSKIDLVEVSPKDMGADQLGKIEEVIAMPVEAKDSAPVKKFPVKVLARAA